MKLIDQPRKTDDLSEFGAVLRFAGLIYESDDEGEAAGSFAPHGIDGDVVFPCDRATADALFDAWVEVLKAAEDQFLEEGDEEGFVALIETPKGLMVLAGSTVMGYPNPDIETLAPGTRAELGMPHVSWDRILTGMFGET